VCGQVGRISPQTLQQRALALKKKNNHQISKALIDLFKANEDKDSMRYITPNTASYSTLPSATANNWPSSALTSHFHIVDKPGICFLKKKKNHCIKVPY
jgi:hypothetical protein